MSLTNKGKFYTLQRLINENKAREIYDTLDNPGIKQIKMREGYKTAIDEARKVLGVIDKTNIAGIKIISRNIIGDEKIEDIVMLYGWRNDNNNYGWILFLYDDNNFDLITEMRYVSKLGDRNIPIPRMYDLKQHQDNGHLYGIFLTYENDSNTYSDINNQEDHVRDFITLSGNQKQFFTFLEFTNPLNHLPSRELLPLEVIKVIEITNVDNLNYEVDKAVHRIYGIDDDEDSYTIAMLKVRDNTTWNADIWPLKFSQEIGKTELGYNVQNADTVKYRGKGGTGTPISLPENIERTLGYKDKLNNLDNFDLKFFENDGSDSDGFLWLTTNLNDDEYFWKGEARIQYDIKSSGITATDSLALAGTGTKNIITYEYFYDNAVSQDELSDVERKLSFYDLLLNISTKQTKTNNLISGRTGFEGETTSEVIGVLGYVKELEFYINLDVLSDVEKAKNKKLSFDINYVLDLPTNWWLHLDTFYFIIYTYGEQRITANVFQDDVPNKENFEGTFTITIDPSLNGEQEVRPATNVFDSLDKSTDLIDDDGSTSQGEWEFVHKIFYGYRVIYERQGDRIKVRVRFELPRDIFVTKTAVGTTVIAGGPAGPTITNVNAKKHFRYRATTIPFSLTEQMRITNINWADGNTKQWIYNVRKNDAANAPSQPTPYPEEVSSVRAPDLLLTPNVRSKSFIQVVNISRETITHNEFSFRKNNQDATTQSTWNKSGDDYSISKSERFGKVKTLGYNNGSFLYYSIVNQRYYLTNFDNDDNDLRVRYKNGILNPVLNAFSAKSLLLTGVIFNNDGVNEVDVMVNSNNKTINYIKDTPSLRNDEVGIGLGTYNLIQQSSTPVINENGFNISVEAEDSQLLNYRTFNRVNIINSDGDSVYEEPLDIKKEVFNPINIDYNFIYNIEIRNGKVKDDVLKSINDSIFKNTERYNWVIRKGITDYTLNIKWDDNSLLLSSDNTFNNGDELELVFKGNETKKVLSFVYDENIHRINNELKLKIYWEEV